MATIPTLHAFRLEDFQDWKEAPKMLSPLNTFIRSVVAAFTNRLTFTSNMACQVSSVDHREATGNYPIRIAWKLKTRPTDLWITRVRTISGTAPTAFGCLWDYSDTDSVLQITSIFGLTTDSRYEIRFIAMSEG